MYLPSVRAPGKTRRQIVQFGGLNFAEDTRDGELSDSRGLSCGAFPGLSQRLGRHKLQDARGVSSIYAWGKLVTVAGDTLYYDSERVGTVTPGQKQFAVVNTKLVVFPDKKYLDLSTDPKEFKSLDAKVETLGDSVTFTADTMELRALHPVLGSYTFRQEQPGGVDLVDAFRFLVYRLEEIAWDPDTGWSLPAGIKKGVTELEVGDCMMLPKSDWRGNKPPIYSYVPGGGAVDFPTEYDIWGDFVCVCGEADFLSDKTGPSYIKIPLERRNAAAANPVLSQGFQAGDVVTVSGCETFPANNRDVKITAVTDMSLTFDSPVFTAGEEAGAVTVDRKIPDLDFICEYGNRLCGVSNKDKTIYVSALGDPRNIFDYTGVATDSYAVVTGTDGEFTGCAAWSGSVLFFKEDCVHRLVGDYPAEYAVYVDHVAGVQKGCAGSIVLLNEVLYYKGREGVYAYTGATPRLISGALGNVKYDSAVAGVDGSVLYVSMRRQDTGAHELLTYDTRRGLWLKEDALEAGGFAQLNGALHMLSSGAVWKLGQGETDDGAAIAWEATFTPFTETVHERKYPSRLLLRLELEPGAWVEAELARDGGAFQTVWASHDSNAITAVIPIRPGRCDRYTVRLRGEGRCLIRSLSREFALGGVL